MTAQIKPGFNGAAEADRAIHILLPPGAARCVQPAQTPLDLPKRGLSIKESASGLGWEGH